jgi:hypothetical protein
MIRLLLTAFQDGRDRRAGPSRGSGRRSRRPFRREGRRATAKLPTRDEARRIAANIAKGCRPPPQPCYCLLLSVG